MTPLWPILLTCLCKPRKTAIVDDQKTWSYAQLGLASFALADTIRRLTDKPRVGLMLPTSGAFPAALMGTWLTGRSAVPLNYLLSHADLHHVAEDSGIDTIITVEKMLEFIGGPEVIPPNVRIVLLEQLDLKRTPQILWPKLPHADHEALLLYTSGTSGKPKGVVLTHGNLAHNVCDIIEFAKDIDYGDTFLGVLPQFHSFGVTALTLWPLMKGHKIVYTARFIPKRILTLIREHHVNLLVAVPSMFGALLSVKDAKPEDLASIKFAISGGEPLSRDLAEQLVDKLNLQLYEGYGLTETAPVTNCSLPGHHKLGAVGKPLPSVRNIIVDEHDNTLPPGQDGEILITGPNVMAGYHNLPDLTQSVLTSITLPDGATTHAFRTGDIGHTDEDGYLYITGRKKEMLIIAGENVFPREIEETLNQHPTIRASAVIGRKDPSRGELPIAFVELEENATLDETDIRNHCRQHMAPFKVPREIHQLPELPRNPTGKILRRSLSEQRDP